MVLQRFHFDVVKLCVSSCILIVQMCETGGKATNDLTVSKHLYHHCFCFSTCIARLPCLRLFGSSLRTLIRIGCKMVSAMDLFHDIWFALNLGRLVFV